MKDHRTITMFDATFGDGEQSPGGAFSADEKVEIAPGRMRLAADAVESGGLANSSPRDFEGARAVGAASARFDALADTREAVTLYDDFEEVAAA